jgi:predicted enzyme related to lactoylglutathione lyase
MQWWHQTVRSPVIDELSVSAHSALELGRPALFCHSAISQKTGEQSMANPFVHIELNTQDVAKAKSFYQSLFAWSLNDMDMGDMTYTMIDVGEGTGGGMMKHPMSGAPSMWLPYVLVDDIVAATAKAKSLGAAVVQDVKEVMGAGSLSIITDPTGATLGLWQPKAK